MHIPHNAEAVSSSAKATEPRHTTPNLERIVDLLMEDPDSERSLLLWLAALLQVGFDRSVDPQKKR